MDHRQKIEIDIHILKERQATKYGALTFTGRRVESKKGFFGEITLRFSNIESLFPGFRHDRPMADVSGW